MPVKTIELTFKQAAGAWSRKVAGIPSVFAQLVFVASLRTGRHYRESELVAVTSRSIADRIIRESHQRIFRKWISLDLKQQSYDLRLYVSSLGLRTLPPRHAAWVKLCHDAVPPDLSDY